MQANYLYKKGIFTGDLNFYYSNSPNRIMEEVIRENNKFIRITDNQKGWQKLSGDLTLRVGPIIKRIVSLSVTGGVNRYISEGNSYSHTYTNWYYRASVMAMYKKFMAMFQIQSSYNRFIGELLKGGENIHMFMFRYNQGKFAVGAGLMMPFLQPVQTGRGKLERLRSQPYEHVCERLLPDVDANLLLELRFRPQV